MSNTLQIETPRWAVPLLEDGFRYYDAHGGRGSGKSFFFGTKLINRCISAPTHALCLREIQKSLAQSVKKLLEDTIKRMNVQGLFEITQSEIRSINGSLILFQGLQNHTVDSLKSYEGFDIFWIEEAQSLSQTSFNILRPTVRKKGSQIWTTWNPRNKTDPIEFIRNDPPPRTVSVEVNFCDNPWFSDTELVAEMEYDRKRDIDRYNHIWLGQHEQNSEARVFKNWRVDVCEPKMNTVFRFGADWGFSIDPTVLVRCWIEGRTLYIDYEAVKYGCEIIDMPLLFATIPESDIYPIVGDSSRPETISHLQKNGYPRLYPSVKGPGSVEDGVEFLKSYDIVVHPRCKHTIKELTNYQYVKDPATGEITGKLKDKDNHVIDALRYGCEAVRRIIKKKHKKVVTLPVRNHWS